MGTVPRTVTGLVLAVGEELPVLRRTYTRERWAWAETAISAGADDEDRSFRPEQSIHSDAAMASAQGLPGRIATGALLVNWISSLLVRHFGLGYIASGSLAVKFVKPVLEDEVVEIHLAVTSLSAAAGATTRCDMDVRLDSSSGLTCVVGTASATVATLASAAGGAGAAGAA